MTENVALRRQRDLGTVISDSFSLLFSDWPRLARMVAPAVMVNLAVSLIAFGVKDNDALVIAVVYLTLPVQFVAYQLVSAAVIAQLNSRDLGRDLDVGDALDVAQDRFGDVAGASLRSAGITILLAVTVIGLPFAIYRFVRWAFIIQSIVVDGQKGEASLAYSAALVQGLWWVTFGRLLVSAIVLGVPAVIISIAIQEAVPGVLGVIASHSPDFLVLPFGIITTTLIFFDRKLQKAANAG